jgi:hypothetical protein
MVLNVHAPTKDKTDDVKDSYTELEHMFDNFPKYHVTILLVNFNAKVVREDIFKPTTGNESLHKITNDNRVRLEKKMKMYNVSTSQHPQIHLDISRWVNQQLN